MRAKRSTARTFFSATAPAAAPEINIRVASFDRTSDTLANADVPAREAALCEEAIALVTQHRVLLQLPPALVVAEAFFCKQMSMLRTIATWTGRALEMYQTLHTFDYLIVRGSSAKNPDSFRRVIEGTRLGTPRAPFTGTIITFFAPEGNGVARIRVFPAAAFAQAIAWVAAGGLVQDGTAAGKAVGGAGAAEEGHADAEPGMEVAGE